MRGQRSMLWPMLARDRRPTAAAPMHPWWRSVDRGGASSPRLGRDLRQGRHQVCRIAHQLRRTFWSNPGGGRQFVGRIAAERNEVRHPLRIDAISPPNLFGSHVARNRGLIDSWCKSLSYNGIIRARSNSTPARPYMARLRVFSLLICPSVCPLLQGSDIAFRTASRSWRIAFAKRCIA